MIDKTAYILSKFPDKSPNSKGVIHTHCPFHDDSRPSFSIDVEEGLFFCGSSNCGVRGGFATFYKLCEGITDWRQVHEDLKQVTSNYDLDELFAGKKYKKKQYALNPFPQGASVESIDTIAYLQDRGIGSEVVQAYGLMYGVGGKYSNVEIRGSIVAPVWDIDHTYKTFQIRYLNPNMELRWVNPEDSPIQDLLYGGWLVSPEDDEMWIVEGASDVWRMYSLGAKAVGLNTKEASSAQMNKIVKLCQYFKIKPIVLLDGDACVVKKKQNVSSADKLYNTLYASGLRPSIFKLEYDEDPGGLSYERFSAVRAGL